MGSWRFHPTAYRRQWRRQKGDWGGEGEDERRRLEWVRREATPIGKLVSLVVSERRRYEHRRHSPTSILCLARPSSMGGNMKGYHVQRTLKEGTLAFLSHGSWQGIGAILGFLSLIVTIVLTIYVFNLGKYQQTAHLSPDLSFFPGGKENYWRGIISITNDGPITSNGLILQVSNLGQSAKIDKCHDEDNYYVVPGMIQPSKYQPEESFGFCVITYNEAILPSQSTQYDFYFTASPELTQKLLTIAGLPSVEQEKMMNDLFWIKITGSNIEVDAKYK